MPLNNLPSVYIPTVVELLLSDPSSRTGVSKAEQRGPLQPWDVWHRLRSQRVGVGRLGGQDAHGPRCVSWSWSRRPQPGPVPTHGTHSSAFQEWAWARAVSVEWAAKPGLAQGFAGLWGNSGWGARWLRSCRLPCTSLQCADPWAAGALGSPCRTGPKASESPSAQILARDVQRRRDNS